MPEIDALNKCIEDGKCSAILYKQTGCPFCTEMKQKLDDLGLEYDEQEIDEPVLKSFDRSTVPFLHISKKEEESDLVIENDTIDRLKRNLGLFEIDDKD